VIEFSLSPWEQTFGLTVKVWKAPRRLQGIFHVEDVLVQDKAKMWRGRVVGLPILKVILKGRLEWVNPYASRVKKRRKKYKAGALTPGYIFTDWPCQDYVNLNPNAYRAVDIVERLPPIKIGQFVIEQLAETMLEIHGDDDPLPEEFIEQATMWDGDRWILR
jgi:hypothetical protein